MEVSMAKDFNTLVEKMPFEVRIRAEEKAQALILEEKLSANEFATQADFLRLENKIEAHNHAILKWILGMLVVQTALIGAVITMFR